MSRLRDGQGWYPGIRKSHPQHAEYDPGTQTVSSQLVTEMLSRDMILFVVKMLTFPILWVIERSILRHIMLDSANDDVMQHSIHDHLWASVAEAEPQHGKTRCESAIVWASRWYDDGAVWGSSLLWRFVVCDEWLVIQRHLESTKITNYGRVQHHNIQSRQKKAGWVAIWLKHALLLQRYAHAWKQISPSGKWWIFKDLTPKQAQTKIERQIRLVEIDNSDILHTTLDNSGSQPTNKNKTPSRTMQKAEQVTNSMLSGRTVRKEQKITVELKRRNRRCSTTWKIIMTTKSKLRKEILSIKIKKCQMGDADRIVHIKWS